jgi:hypothetical protein
MKALLFLILLATCDLPQPTPEPAPTPIKVAVSSAQIDTSFVNQLMDTCKVKLSDSRKKILADQLVRITRMRFSKIEHQQAFTFLVCIESKFDSGAKSKSGAIGLTQVMPKFAGEFAKDCGLPSGVTAADLTDSETSLLVGSCHFKSLIEYYNSVALALAAYNSGKDSASVKSLNNLGEGHPETTGYISKFMVLKEKMEKKHASK